MPTRKTEITTAIAEATQLNKEQAAEVLNVVLDEITMALSKEESVAIPGFGSFVLRQRQARTGRSPRTGEPVEIPASTSVGFKPGKALKDAVNPGE